MLRQNSKHLEIKYCQIKDSISRYNFWQSKQILTTNCMNIKTFEGTGHLKVHRYTAQQICRK